VTVHIFDFDFQVFIHNPAVRNSGRLSSGRAELATHGDISLLNINQVISSVAAGRLDPQSTHDTLVVGTQTNLLGYDVMNNRDIFYKDVS
jgi:Bardet-Biedl syndrome 2 protein